MQCLELVVSVDMTTLDRVIATGKVRERLEAAPDEVRDVAIVAHGVHGLRDAEFARRPVPLQ